MRSSIARQALLVTLVASVACGRWEPGDYTSGGNTNLPGGTQTPGQGGGEGETPNPQAPCPTDPDGVDTFLPLTLAEMRFGESGFLEFVNRSDPESDLPLEEITIVGTLDVDLSGTLKHGHRLVTKGALPLSGELAIELNGSLLQYVCWGQQPPSTLQNEAILATVWTGPCVIPPSTALSVHLRGLGRVAGDWVAGTPTPNHCP